MSERNPIAEAEAFVREEGWRFVRVHEGEPTRVDADELRARIAEYDLEPDDEHRLLHIGANLAIDAAERANGAKPASEEPRVFPGLSYDEMLKAEVDPAREIVADLILAGTVGTIASVPELGKSYLALEIAHKVAAGGTVLGTFDVRRTGPVAYYWQDDSKANELARLKRYAEIHGYATAPPDLRVHLNEGARLPDDLGAIRDEIERERQTLVVLDSLYNFLPAGGLKDEEVSIVFSAMKTELCDPTGAAVLVIDHAPWPTESNRGQRRAYGSVFKGAAIRWGIYLEPRGTKTYISARGNDVRGFKSTPCYFDADHLQIRLVDAAETNHAEAIAARAEQVLAWLREHPGRHSTAAVKRGAGGNDAATADALKHLLELAAVQDEGTDGQPWSGIGGAPRYWKLSSEAALTAAQQTAAEVGSGSGGDPADRNLGHLGQHPVGVAEVPAGSGSDTPDDDPEAKELGWR